MRITWITRSFLDYRIPVFEALDKMCNHQLTVIYYKDIPPQRTQKKIKNILGNRAIAHNKELRIGNKPKIDNASKGNTTFRIPISPGLIKQVIKSKPDVLISDGFMQWTYAALFVRAIKKIPHVMCYERTAHTERNAGKLRIAYRKFVSRWIDAIDCNGQQTGSYIKNLLQWDESRLTYGHMVADVNGMQKAVNNINNDEVHRLKLQLGIKGVMILYVGQLIPRKGVKELLSAWKYFIKKEKATLVYVGEGELKKELTKQIYQEQIPNVILTGAIDYDKIAVYYKAADCFIIPTIEDNWSLVVPEAMACGLPIATSKYNGCYPELVHPNNGWVFDSLNQRSIINVLNAIIDNKNQLREMGNASKLIISTETADKAAQSIMNAINIAIKKCNNEN